MAEFRPLSRRDVGDDRFDVPQEGLPSYFVAPIRSWLSGFLWSDTSMGERYYENAWLYSLQLKLRLDPPLAPVRHSEDSAAADDLLQRLGADEELALDVIDYALQSMLESGYVPYRAEEIAQELNMLLSAGNSVWQAVAVEGQQGTEWRLERRDIGPGRETIQDLEGVAPRVHAHLMASWERLAGRHVDASGAYREAVRAVEAAARPVVLPSNDRATLGQMIVALRDKPDKWETTLGTVDHVRKTMETVWTGQLDRHGTDDESIPLNVSQAEADAAFHWCLTLTRLVVGGHFWRAN